MQIHRWDCHTACRIEEGLILKEFLMSTLLRACPGLCARYCQCLLGQAMLSCSYGLHIVCCWRCSGSRTSGDSGLDSPYCEDSFMGQPRRLPLWIPGCPCHKAPSLREVTNRITTSSTIKKNLSSARFINGQFLCQVIKSRYVVNAVLIHHAHQLGIYHL